MTYIPKLPLSPKQRPRAEVIRNCLNQMRICELSFSKAHILFKNDTMIPDKKVKNIVNNLEMSSHPGFIT